VVKNPAKRSAVHRGEGKEGRRAETVINDTGSGFKETEMRGKRTGTLR